MHYLLNKTYHNTPPNISVNNRSFRYGDGFFESMALFQQEIPLFDYHWKRMQRSASLLKLDWAESKEVVLERMIHFAKKSEIENGRMRWMLSRKEGGLYTPSTNEADELMELVEKPNQQFELNQTGLCIDIYTDHCKPMGELGSIKSNNALLYVLASLWRMEDRLDDCLLLNTEKNIAEASSSNLLLWDGTQLITPNLEQGAVDGVMRRVLLDIAKANKIEVVETIVPISLLSSAKEVWLCNAVSGIRWVKQFREKSFEQEQALLFTNKLNQFIQS